MTIIGNTRSSKLSLDQLRSVRPNDGWSIEITNKNDLVRLLRRNVPINDNYFIDIHYCNDDDSIFGCGSNMIVGVMTNNGDTCQVLVDGSNGKLVSSKEIKIVSVKNYKYIKLTETEMRRSAAAAAAATSTSITKRDSTRRPSTSSSTPLTADGRRNNDAVPFQNPFSNLSDNDQIKYLKYGAGAFIAYVVLQILSSILSEFLLFFLLLPGLYFYLSSTCPPNNTFDTKKEVKRVLRGYHLPDDHPSKPRKGNFIEEWTTRITASVATELGTAAGGYSVEMIPLLLGVATYTTVDIPALSMRCEWIGIHDKWYHIRSSQQQTQ
jgi:hypothetical protein